MKLEWNFVGIRENCRRNYQNIMMEISFNFQSDLKNLKYDFILRKFQRILDVIIENFWKIIRKL